jgi:hypothetical protein
MPQWPPWCSPGRRVWFHQTQTYIGAADELGLVLEQRRRGLCPVRRRLTLTEARLALECGELRPCELQAH